MSVGLEADLTLQPRYVCALFGMPIVTRPTGVQEQAHNHEPAGQREQATPAALTGLFHLHALLGLKN